MSNISDVSEVPSWPVQKCRSASCENMSIAFFCSKCINDHYAIKRRYDRVLANHREAEQQKVVNEHLKKRDAKKAEEEGEWAEVDNAVKRVKFQYDTPKSPEIVAVDRTLAPKKLDFTEPVSVPVTVDPRIMKLPDDVIAAYGLQSLKAEARKKKAEELEANILRLKQEIKEMREDFF